jgi:hypothetical protein
LGEAHLRRILKSYADSAKSVDGLFGISDKEKRSGLQWPF